MKSLQSKAAELMLDSGEWHTAASLGKLLNVSAHTASGLLYNIRMSKRYQTQETPTPGRKVKVIAIGERKISHSTLWGVALGLPSRKAA